MGLHVPLLIVGATTSRTHGGEDRAELQNPVHVVDASRAVGVATALLVMTLSRLLPETAAVRCRSRTPRQQKGGAAA